MAKTMVFGIMRDLDAEQAAYRKREDIIHAAVVALRAHEIARICAIHELESDEFLTREQKALRYLAPTSINL